MEEPEQSQEGHGAEGHWQQGLLGLLVQTEVLSPTLGWLDSPKHLPSSSSPSPLLSPSLCSAFLLFSPPPDPPFSLSLSLNVHGVFPHG